MSLTLTVHRGTQQIGGSCIEVAAADGTRLILDAGRPLDAPKEVAGLLPATLDLSRPAHVVVSHPHMDHWGLLGELPGDWPVWTGETAARLIHLTAALFAMPEAEVEHRIAALAREVPGHVFVEWFAQNLDRTVSLYRAAKRTGRKLVVDLYTADVLQAMPEASGIPRPGPFPALEVMITPALARYYERKGRADFVQGIIATGCATSRTRVAARPSIVTARRSLLRDFSRGDALPITAADAWLHSNWCGYLDEADESGGWHRARTIGARCEHIHTSGHASPALLGRFAAAIAPLHLLPVHGVAWDDPDLLLPSVKRLGDGESWNVR